MNWKVWSSTFAIGAAFALLSGSVSAEQATTGTLSIDSTPPAHVWVDDKDTQKVTPLVRFPVSAGKHKVTLVGEGNKKKSISVNVKAGEDTRLRINFSE